MDTDDVYFMYCSGIVSLYAYIYHKDIVTVPALLPALNTTLHSPIGLSAALAQLGMATYSEPSTMYITSS